MKRTLLGTVALFALAALPASAADMAPKMVTKAPAAVVWDWTGWYVGAYAGIGVNRSRVSNSTGDIDFVNHGFAGGGTVGYNWQFAKHWVVGIEGDIGYFGLGRSFADFNEDLTVNQQTSWLATLRGRFGYTSSPNLSYITGGAAWVHTKDSLVSSTGAGSNSETKTGWTIGTGTETMLGGGWTAKAETLYVDAGQGSPISDGLFFTYQADHKYYTQRFGVNYLFGGKPPASALPQYNWSGFYVGLVGGTAIAQARVSDFAGTTSSAGEFGNNGTGYHAGGIVGWNWQFAPTWVAGVEGDFSWMGIDHTINQYNDTPSVYTLKTNWMATARGRLAYSTGPALLYITGGGAWVNVTESAGIFSTTPVPTKSTLSGYTVGGGIETTLAGGWASRTEYLFVDVGNGPGVCDSAATYCVQAYHQFHLFRGTLTYKFGG